MSRYLLFAALVLGIALATWEIARRGAHAYERMLVARVSNGLEVLGFGWADVRADGFRLELHGHAPDTFARELALESIRATAPIATVTSFATTTLAPPERREPVRVELHRDQRGITMTGQTASRRMRQRLNAALAADGPELAVRDLTGIQAAPPPRGWGLEITVASLAAVALPNAYVVMEPGRVFIDGQATDRSERTRLVAALRAVAGDRVTLSLRIRIPARLIAPFAFAAVRDAGGALRLETCAVRSEGEQAAMRTRLTGLGLGEHVAPCAIGLGGPGGDWTAALDAGLAALVALPAGRLDVEYRAVRLTGHPPSTPEAFAAATAALNRALPDGFVAEGVLMGDDVATRTGIAREQFWMTLSRTAFGVTIAGQVPDRAAETAILAYARALFGSAKVHHSLLRTGTAAPGRWQIAAMALLDQLALGEGGEAEMAGHALTLRGKLSDPALVRQIHRELAFGLPSYRVSTVFEIDLPNVLAAIPLPGPRCAAALNDVNHAKPVDFTTGSAMITPESAAILDDLAGLFERCAPDPIEIGGHTDANGPEALNARLSQERADAVVAALVNRGVRHRRLRARGYGETVPIADNETEEGRARNRRIEFRPAEPAATRDEP